MRTRRMAALALGLMVSVGACSSGHASSGSPPGTQGGNNNPPANAAEGFEGSLTTSGTYAATWTVSKDYAPDVLDSVNSVELTSDRQTFGYISVHKDGSISFGSGATELSANGAYKGSGATVTLDHTGRFVCAFTLDTDLTGSNDGTTLHIRGGLTAHYHPQGLGDLNCP
jgi:hypothetical protein